MKISVNSWHYRYMRKLGFSAPSNLCPYFWKLMFSLAVPVAVLALTVLVLIALVLAAIWVVHHLVAFGIGLAITLGIVAAIIGLGWLIFSTASRRAFAAVGQVRVIGGIAEGASLTSEYIAAVHHKLCPRLDFVDEKAPPRELRVI